MPPRRHGPSVPARTTTPPRTSPTWRRHHPPPHRGPPCHHAKAIRQDCRSGHIGPSPRLQPGSEGTRSSTPPAPGWRHWFCRWSWAGAGCALRLPDGVHTGQSATRRVHIRQLVRAHRTLARPPATGRPAPACQAEGVRASDLWDADVLRSRRTLSHWRTGSMMPLNPRSTGPVAGRGGWLAPRFRNNQPYPKYATQARTLPRMDDAGPLVPTRYGRQAPDSRRVSTA